MEQMYNETGKKYDLQRYYHHLHWAAGSKGKAGDMNQPESESSEEEDIQVDACRKHHTPNQWFSG